MLDSFIIGALTSLIVSIGYALFRKPTKKVHAQIQMGISIVIAVILFLVMFTHIVAAITAFILELFVIRKIYINYKLIKNDNFNGKTESNKSDFDNKNELDKSNFDNNEENK